MIPAQVDGLGTDVLTRYNGTTLGVIREPELINRLPVPVWFAADRTGCGYYRAVLPAKVVGGAVQYEIPVIHDYINDVPIAYENMGWTNTFQRPVDEKVIAAIRDIRKLGAKTLVEVDDDVWGLNYQNPAIKYWPKERLQVLAKCIREAEGVVVSTKPLASVVGRYNRNVTVIPNAIDLEDIVPKERDGGDGIVRVGWAGSYTHREDLKLALPAMREISGMPNVRMHIFGYDPFDGTVPHVFHRWSMDPIEHLKKIGILDVAIAPLINNNFNQSKSAIKWMEHAAHATPMVVSAVRPYLDVVRHGETAFVARTPGDFSKYLRILIENPKVRADIGRAAQYEVVANHTMTERAAAWKEITHP
jgi:glycosyltransferase involved in cell wall biosynthesis